MMQVLQNLRNGDTALAEVASPGAGPNQLLIASRTSLISSGTERMLLDFGKGNWLEKARQQPDKVRMVLDKVLSDGVAAAADAVRARLDRPMALGYSNAGAVIDVGAGVHGYQRGIRVVSNGPHAEVVAVPQNLCAPIPDEVGDDAAAFAVVGAIALQGIRLANPTLGEVVAVTGLGLIGLLTVQLLRAQGCRVLGIDPDPRKLEIARSFGAEVVDLSAGHDPQQAAQRLSQGHGVDAAIITASTRSNEPVHQAALMCRKRGRIVLVGVTGLELSRDDFYKKELSFQVSCSYGPGRYDPDFEQRGHDYPLPYVRWTAQRNFAAVLDLMAAGSLRVEPLITHRFPFERALDAYRLLDSGEFSLGILLGYNPSAAVADPAGRRVVLRGTPPPSAPAGAALGWIGAGAYATRFLIPAFQKAGAKLLAVASNTGLSAVHAGRKFGFAEATTDVDAIFDNPAIDTVVIATRHDSHAELVCRALRAGKHVFVEKPLALDAEQLEQIETAWRAASGRLLLMAGFNRRFSPHAVRLRELLSGMQDPKTFVYTVNAGAVPPDHWTRDPETGGGRLVGEACHFLDLLRFLAGCPARTVQAVRQSAETAILTVTYEDGSMGAIHYLATGHKSFPKERVEVFAGGRIVVLDNFRRLRAYGWPGFGGARLWRQNKGAEEMAAAFVQAIRTAAPPPIPFDQLLEVSRAAIQAAAL